MAWRRGLVVTPPPFTDKTIWVVRSIPARVVAFRKKYAKDPFTFRLFSHNASAVVAIFSVALKIAQNSFFIFQFRISVSF
jgi:hypothetical protein